MKKNISILFFLSILTMMSGQEIKHTQYSSWNSFIPKMKIHEQWDIASEFHFRRTDFLKDWEQFIIRPSINYKLNSSYKFSVGYSYVRNYDFSSFSTPINANEHNVWQQVALSHHSNTLNFNHRFRIEERFIDNVTETTSSDFKIDGTNYSNRFRYRITLKKPVIKIKENKFITAKAFNELFINLEKGIRPKSFNQNWFYVGLDYPINKHFTLGMGYHNIGLKGSGNTFITNHILQTTISYSLN